MVEIKNKKGEVIYTYDGDTLVGADLHGLDLRGANLHRLDLHKANLSECNLIDADFSYSNLSFANLCGADLTGADIHLAKLNDAYLYNSNLTYANLSEAKLYNVKYDETTKFFALQCPEKGSFIAYKKVKHYIVELEIPEDAKRSSATTRKCRCSKAKVLGIYNFNNKLTDIKEVTNHNYKDTEYKVGEMVYPDSWDEDRWNECSHGIHFFMTFQEAVNYKN